MTSDVSVGVSVSVSDPGPGSRRSQRSRTCSRLGPGSRRSQTSRTCSRLGPGSRRSQTSRTCSRPLTLTLTLTLTFLAPKLAKADPCTDPDVTKRLAELVHLRRFADAHHAATDLRVQCGNNDSWRLLDDISLIRLEDRVYALADLNNLQTPSADIILAWAYLTNRDTQAASAVLPRIPEPRRAALIALSSLDDEDRFAAAARSLDPRALSLGHRYHAARVKSPALAGVMSAVLPGSGQLYAGSLQAAAVTFVLNSLFIGATVELARDKDYVTAAAAGTAASVFYIGGIINAADLARRRNRIAQQPYADELEELLVPEVSGTLGP